MGTACTLDDTGADSPNSQIMLVDCWVKLGAFHQTTIDL